MAAMSSCMVFGTSPLRNIIVETTPLVAIIAAAGIGVTLIVLLVRGSFQLGKLVNKVGNLDDKVDSLDDKLGNLAEAVNELRREVQQSNRTLAALANHRHDVDGNTVFNVPQS